MALNFIADYRIVASAPSERMTPRPRAQQMGHEFQIEVAKCAIIRTACTKIHINNPNLVVRFSKCVLCAQRVLNTKCIIGKSLYKCLDTLQHFFFLLNNIHWNLFIWCALAYRPLSFVAVKRLRARMQSPARSSDTFMDASHPMCILFSNINRQTYTHTILTHFNCYDKTIKKNINIRFARTRFNNIYLMSLRSRNFNTRAYKTKSQIGNNLIAL